MYRYYRMYDVVSEKWRPCLGDGTGTAIRFGSNRPSLWQRWQRHMMNTIYIALHNAGFDMGDKR